ncbi:MAG: glycosyltransferase family 4 protein [Candidatus Dormibacteraeota bacterium]|nr:glycosyltransferase family 4 protein [Candidatus Dormibacteraeota bacterium]
MRVTFVAYDDTPSLGGQGVMLAGMRDELTARGVDVATISGRGEHAIRYPRVTHRAPLDLSLWLNRKPQLLRRREPDIVHAHGGPGGVLLLRALDVPLVYTAHHTYRQAYGRSSPRRVLDPLEARAYRRAARVLAVSQSTADALMAMRVAADRIEVLPPGVHTNNDSVAQHEPGRMLFVGRLEPEKGALTAARDVMLPLVGRRRGSTGVVVGDGRLRPQMRALLRDEPSIALLGRVDDDRLASEYERARVLVMPSLYEGLGLVALEAQARGTPVVGYDVTGLRDAVRGGVLVPAGDVAALRASTLRLLDDDARWTELSESGRDFVRREHSWDVIGPRLLDIYESVVPAVRA